MPTCTFNQTEVVDINFQVLPKHCNVFIVNFDAQCNQKMRIVVKMLEHRDWLRLNFVRSEITIVCLQQQTLSASNFP